MKERVWVLRTANRIIGVYGTSEAAGSAKAALDTARIKLGAVSPEYHSSIERFEVES